MKINRIRLKIIELLNQFQGKFISGEEISNQLNVSRTTISNYINELRNLGYIIESRTKQGYRLVKTPDKIIPEEIFRGLNTEIIGQTVFCFDTIKSTNEKAKILAEEEVPSGTLVIAERQQEGRGRRGKKWFSPDGGLWFSLILRPEFSPEKAPFLTIIAALAIKKVLNKYDIKPFAKWPNDILLKGKKVSGVLTELSAEIDQIKYAVIGIGINVNQKKLPEDIKDIAVSLKQFTGKKTNRIKLLQEILCVFEKYYYQLQENKEKEIITMWKKELNILNKEVKIKANNNVYQGKAVDISDGGALIIEDRKGKRHTFWSGEASLVKNQAE